MILVRNVFRLKFGKAREAKAALNKMREISDKRGFHRGRLISDFIGPAYTLVLEIELEDLTLMNRIGELFGDPEWQSAYREFVPFAESGYREIFTIEN